MKGAIAGVSRKFATGKLSHSGVRGRNSEWTDALGIGGVKRRRAGRYGKTNVLPGGRQKPKDLAENGNCMGARFGGKWGSLAKKQRRKKEMKTRTAGSKEKGDASGEARAVFIRGNNSKVSRKE